jgi:FolB domain-containing protein
MTDDRIEIRDLLLRGILGINDWEREKPQDILVNITLFADLRAAGAGDDLNQSVNYRTVTKKVIEHVEGSRRFTVEALAADLARLCLQEPGVKRARVRVEKPGALRFARSVGVEIERESGDFS